MDQRTEVPAVPRADLNAESYAQVRGVLARSGYSGADVLNYLGVEAIPDVFESGFFETVSRTVDTPLAALTHLFLIGRGVGLGQVEALLGSEFLEAGRAQGILLTRETYGLVYATVTIEPSLSGSEGVWLVSDRVIPVPEAGLPGFAEAVYPTVTPSAQLFVRLLPRREGGRFFEACAGCGPAAMIAGEFAEEVHAGDIDRRAVAFCAYNARLNDVGGFRAIEGSYYSNTDGAYDLIAAHPPYMPIDGAAEVFYSGGIDGTVLLRELIAQLPGKLKPGGLFYAVAMIPESAEIVVEARVREWLGEDAGHFDVFFFPLHTRSLIEVAYEATAKVGGGSAAASQYRRKLLEMGHREFHFGALLLRFHDGPEPTIQVRRKLSPRTTWEEVLWCVDWETGRKDAEQNAEFASGAVKASEDLEVVITHRVESTGLEPQRFQAITRYPFEMESEIQGWMAALLGQCDGTRSVLELFASAKEQGMIHPETPIAEFIRLLSMFVSGGFLESSICPLPLARG